MKRMGWTLLCMLLIAALLVPGGAMAADSKYVTDDFVAYQCDITNIIYESGGTSLYSSSYGRAMLSFSLALDMAIKTDSDLLSNFMKHDTYFGRSSYKEYFLVGYTDYSIVVITYDCINGSARYALFDRQGASDSTLDALIEGLANELASTTCYKNDQDDLYSVAAEIGAMLK